MVCTLSMRGCEIYWSTGAHMTRSNFSETWILSKLYIIKRKNQSIKTLNVCFKPWRASEEHLCSLIVYTYILIDNQPSTTISYSSFQQCCSIDRAVAAAGSGTNCSTRCSTCWPSRASSSDSSRSLIRTTSGLIRYKLPFESFSNRQTMN